MIVGLALAASLSAYAQNSQYGAVDNFYQANVDINTGQYAARVVNPAYWLVDSSRWNEMDSRLSGGGFVRLGTSTWISNNASGGGVPQKDVAMAYAHAIGADVIIYAIEPAADKYNWTAHWLAFYARQGALQAASTAPARRPTSAEATAAINRAQDECHEPHVKGGVTYNPQTDTYSWIGPIHGEHRSKPASWFLDKFGSYL